MLPHMEIGLNEVFDICIEIKAPALPLIVSGRFLESEEETLGASSGCYAR